MTKPVIFSVALILLLSACLPGSEPQPLSDTEIQTAIAGTAQSIALQLQATMKAVPTTQTETETLAPTDTAAPSATQTASLLPPIPEAACVPPGNPVQIGLVTNVVDGDTIDVEIDSQVFPVRYIGMDSPEPHTEIDAFADEATAKNRELVDGQAVLLVKDASETDQYGRLLRFVFVGNAFVNYEMVKQGFAKVTTYSPDISCEAIYLEAEDAAKVALLGLWALPTSTPFPTETPLPTATFTPRPQPTTTNPPPPPPQPTPQPTEPPKDCDPSYPDVCIPRRSKVGDLDCKDIPYRRFRVLPPDPHNFDGDHDGIGCES